MNTRVFIHDDYLVTESKMIPLIHALPIKIKGTTKTISAFDGIKGVTNKQLNLVYTNTPIFSGKPPGQQN